MAPNMLTVFVLHLCTSAFAQAPPLPADHDVKGTAFLDHETPIQNFVGQTFLKDNIPFIDIPDKSAEDVYYRRFSALQQQLRYTSAGIGYTITDSVQPMKDAGAFGSSNAAAGNHIEEAQWLRGTFYAQDYIQVWTRGPGDPGQYKNRILEAAASAANVTGNFGFLQAQLEGMPSVVELDHPEKNAWRPDSSNCSKDYMHPTNNHDVITGLLGFIPRADDTVEISPLIPQDWTYFALENAPYHGFVITVLYDKDGSRYGEGAGLSIFANGKKIQHKGKGGFSGTAQLPGNHAQQPTPDSPAPLPIDVNIAATPYGEDHWPRISATYTSEQNNADKAIDGYVNTHWTTYGSPNPNDTLAISLPRPRKMKGIVLTPYTDDSNGIACPAAIHITDSDGTTTTQSTNCLPNDKTTIPFTREIETSTLHLTFTPQEGSAAGLRDLEIWTPASTGSFYIAVDYALPRKQAAVEFDATASASDGAVIAAYATSSEVAFSGIYSARGGMVDLRLEYKNSGTAAGVAVGVEVNRVVVGNVTLQRTRAGAGFYGVVVPGVELRKGGNFVTVLGGGEGVLFSGLGIL